MTSSMIALAACSFLFFTLLNIVVWVPLFIIYYLFIKRARLYCRVKKELKCVLNERDIALKQISQK
ncbi:hypothetical protein [Bartonella tribocorum]|uniref:Uncharacterized protein n=1 Tax=Bartonella tribocorum TaxID=85701 RepID=A0A2N9Y8U7_9HYPH|nr:hypothetical protein [Bartonella tribocorum]PIT68130.1 hypothetical protein CER18_08200 [Bartonella tribocorum]